MVSAGRTASSHAGYSDCGCAPAPTVPAPRRRRRRYTRRRWSDPGPVARLGTRLRGLNPESPDSYGVTDLSGPGPRAAGWLPTGAVVPAMAAGSGTHLGISPAVAGARLVGSLAYAALGRPAVALAVTGQVYDPGPDSLMVMLDEDGLVQRIGVRNPVLTVPRGDRLSGRSRVRTLTDRTAVIRATAARGYATLAPWIEEVHQLTHFGRVPMWNLAADSILGPATTAPRLAGADQRAGRQIGHLLLDALTELGAPIHRRGTLHEVTCPDGGPPELVAVRGACCLYFRQNMEKCATCPLVQNP